MKFDSKYIQNIISANNDNSLAIFVGAGISKSSDTKSFKLPIWDDLIADLKNDLRENSENDYLKIAQLYYLAFGEHTYYKKLKEYFPDYIIPSKIHKLIFEINPHVIITTNWDNILERAIEENAYIFDVICSDKDLVKSSLQNKLIKMHGDFKNHNIVFKEDDYINYQYNCPLLENYIKSILSTHTVLFIGYSYNDINLKQILKWVQNHSDVRPPMYLAMFNSNPSQSKYLENHGITTLVLNDKDNTISDFDDYSNKTYAFLNRIKSFDEINIVKSENETIDFILKKLKIFYDLNGLLLEQIQKALSNCGFLFEEDSKPILEFYSEVLTGDFNKSKRSIYKQFVIILKDIDGGKKPNPKILKIFEILYKARIKGIVVSQNNISNSSQEYIPFSEYLQYSDRDPSKEYFDFNFKNLIKSKNEVSELFDLAFKFYEFEKIEEAYSLLEEAISICLKQRNYTLLFIAMFNRNVLLRQLKFGFNSDRDKYSNIEEYNLKERFFNLPKDLQMALEPIYNFINISFIYQYAYNIAEGLRKTEDSKRTIEFGGMVFNSDIHKFSSKHENLVFFVLRNKIMIENFTEYRSINEHFVRIAIIRQIQNEISSLNRIELFSCIKYIDYKILKLLLDDFYNHESEKKGKFQISKEDKAWLINIVFDNILEQLLSLKLIFNTFESYIEKLLFILSLVELESKEIENILNKINKLLLEGNNTIGIFQSINLFLGIQHNLYKTEITEKLLINLIENLIEKLVYKKFNGHEYHALSRNELSNLYGYARERKAILKNEKLIVRLLNELQEYSILEKMEICQNLLLRIYDISNKKIKDRIKSFILGIDSTKEKVSYRKIVFELTLIIYDFKPPEDSTISDLDKYMKQYKDGNSFSTAVYMLNSQVDYLIKNKNIKSFQEISELIKTVINRYEETKRLSIF